MDESGEGCPKSDVLSDDIDTVSNLIMRDRHEIEVILSFSSSQKDLFSLDLTLSQKDDDVDWCKQMLNKNNDGAAKQ